jgi:hypothetical protein
MARVSGSRGESTHSWVYLRRRKTDRGERTRTQCEISSRARLLVDGPKNATDTTTCPSRRPTKINTASTPNWPRSQAMTKPVKIALWRLQE